MRQYKEIIVTKINLCKTNLSWRKSINIINHGNNALEIQLSIYLQPRYLQFKEMILWIWRRVGRYIYFCFIDYATAFDCVDDNKLWKILKEMGIPDHLTYLLRNLYVGQEATIRTGHGTTDWFQIGKGICQGCILSPCLFN